MSRKRILLVDDDPVTHLIVLKMVSVLALPWDVKTCSHPAQVFSFFSDEKWRPDLAIIDHYMPDLEGPALIQLLWQHGEPLTWVGISSSVQHNLWKQEHSAEAYFTKPITPDMLQICDTLAQFARVKQTQNQEFASDLKSNPSNVPLLMSNQMPLRG